MVQVRLSHSDTGRYQMQTILFSMSYNKFWWSTNFRSFPNFFSPISRKRFVNFGYNWLCFICRNNRWGNKIFHYFPNYFHFYYIDVNFFYCVSDYMGRKWSMILVNVPFIIAWIMMYNSTSLVEIFIANTLLGLGCGLMETPVIVYVGEIWYDLLPTFGRYIHLVILPFHCSSEPNFRSFLMAYTYVGSTFGALFVSILNTLMPWRMVAFAYIFVPILTLIILCFVSNSSIFAYFLWNLWAEMLINRPQSLSVGLPQAFFSSIRSQRPRCGCYQRIDHIKLMSRFVGSVVGFQKTTLPTSFKHFNATTTVRSRVLPASNWISCVHIHWQACSKIFENSNGNKHSSHCSS